MSDYDPDSLTVAVDDGIRPNDVVMVVEPFADYEGQIGIVQERADPNIYGREEFWVVFGRDDPTIDDASDRLVWHYPPSALLILGMLGVISDAGNAVIHQGETPSEGMIR